MPEAAVQVRPDEPSPPENQGAPSSSQDAALAAVLAATPRAELPLRIRSALQAYVCGGVYLRDDRSPEVQLRDAWRALGPDQALEAAHAIRGSVVQVVGEHRPGDDVTLLLRSALLAAYIGASEVVDVVAGHVRRYQAVGAPTVLVARLLAVLHAFVPDPRVYAACQPLFDGGGTDPALSAQLFAILMECAETDLVALLSRFAHILRVHPESVPRSDIVLDRAIRRLSLKRLCHALEQVPTEDYQLLFDHLCLRERAPARWHVEDDESIVLTVSGDAGGRLRPSHPAAAIAVWDLLLLRVAEDGAVEFASDALCGDSVDVGA